MTEKGPVKVQDLAKKFNLSTGTLLGLLKELGYSLKSPASPVNEEMIQAITRLMEERRKKYQRSLEKKKEIWGIQGDRRRGPRDRRLTKEKIREKIKRTLHGTPKKEPSRRRSRVTKGRPSERPVEERVQEEKTLVIPAPVTVAELAKMMGVNPVDVIKEAMTLGVMASINQTLDLETITVLAERFGFTVSTEAVEEEIVEEEVEYTEPRPPVVTVMGHVDHGKTTLLDYIRKTNIAAKEYGEITQHIGASRVFHEGHQITFIDTPGHEAFTALRARGAQVTDIVILVVSAVEGVKPQTVEAINHAKAAGVPIIVAINKMDLPDADPERVKRELADHGLIPEDWGGDTIMVEVSAKTGEGVDVLLDAVLLMAEELDLRSMSKGKARGVILESRLEKGRGPVATVIVQRGTLKIGDPFVAGTSYGKVRAIYDEFGNRLKELKPSDPGLVQGFDELPRAGDQLIVVDSEREAREKAEERKELLKHQMAKGDQRSLTRRIQELLQKGEITEVPVIVKADCQGSVEAIGDALTQMVFQDIRIDLIHSGIGNITESDVMLASASNALILGFNVGVDARAREAAKREGVEIRTYKVIYDLLEDIEKVLKGMLEPEYQEEILGTAEVREIFKIPKVGTVAGCYVLRGVIRRDAKIRVRRDSEVVFEGKIASLKRFKEDVREVSQGYECGVRVEGFDDVRVGDILEAYTLVEVERELSR